MNNIGQERPIVETVPNEFDYFEPKQIQAALVNEFDR